MKKFTILIEDDWEIAGNGLGNVAELQYLPALKFMDITDSFGIKLTFMAEVAQQLTFSKFQHQNRQVKIQKELWDESVLTMIERGHDVQLHLHPQWIDASYQNDFFHVNGNWNIGSYDFESQQNLISKSCTYLETLVKTIDPNYTLSAFKGGSWGLQPSENLLNILQQNGIKIVLGVAKGIEIPGAGVNYSYLEEDTLPYHPDFKDITKVSKTNNQITVIPIPFYEPSLLKLFPYVKHNIKKKLTSKLGLYKSIQKVPTSIRKNQPLRDRKKFNFSTKPFRIHLNIGDEPFPVLKQSFDATINRLRKNKATHIPIVIESHTKMFKHNYYDISKFLEYVLTKYDSEVQFSTISSYLKETKQQ